MLLLFFGAAHAALDSESLALAPTACSGICRCCSSPGVGVMLHVSRLADEWMAILAP